jgi:hypothetical protein
VRDTLCGRQLTYAGRFAQQWCHRSSWLTHAARRLRIGSMPNSVQNCSVPFTRLLNCLTLASVSPDPTGQPRDRCLPASGWRSRRLFPAPASGARIRRWRTEDGTDHWCQRPKQRRARDRSCLPADDDGNRAPHPVRCGSAPRAGDLVDRVGLAQAGVAAAGHSLTRYDVLTHSSMGFG